MKKPLPPSSGCCSRCSARGLTPTLAFRRGEPVNSGLSPHRRGLHLRHRLPVLLEMDCRARARARRPPRHALRGPRRRQGFRQNEQMDRLRPSLRGDCRAGTARRAGAGGAIRLPARHAVDFDRRRARRRGAGFRHSVLLDPARRQIARANGEGGIEFAGGRLSRCWRFWRFW